ncbi:Hypothetical protein R9X50_00783400 [Acrodontium crateriforme]|uniref:Uncharacterized protein n=1 Tax=Acrodontium crateriforme TaxID=150365 RepID=A0AAQ3ME63_9PEZI|nr:Hypothetical protein R9X50_00783400 [Acrodontium crateriforme]
MASPLLALPAELRLSIYECALAPTGVLALHATKTKRRAVTPMVSPALLCTCKQICREATAILYRENEITVLIDAHDTCWPTLAENRLPQRVLEQLRSFCAVLDCTGFLASSYSDVDFGPFAGLSQLRILRVGVLYRKITRTGLPGSEDEVVTSYGSDEKLATCMTELVLRIPSNCSVIFGLEEGSHQEDFLLGAVQSKMAGKWGMTAAMSQDDLSVELMQAAHTQDEDPMAHDVDLGDGLNVKNLSRIEAMVPREAQGRLAAIGVDCFSESKAWFEYYKTKGAKDMHKFAWKAFEAQCEAKETVGVIRT